MARAPAKADCPGVGRIMQINDAARHEPALHQSMNGSALFRGEPRINAMEDDEIERRLQPLSLLCQCPETGFDEFEIGKMCGHRPAPLDMARIDIHPDKLPARIGRRQQRRAVAGSTSQIEITPWPVQRRGALPDRRHRAGNPHGACFTMEKIRIDEIGDITARAAVHRLPSGGIVCPKRLIWRSPARNRSAPAWESHPPPRSRAEAAKAAHASPPRPPHRPTP